MCGRFSSRSSPADLATHFGAERVVAPDLGARYNVAPTDEVYGLAVRAGECTLGSFRWGLVPAWASSPRGAARMINARAESVADKAAFRTAFARRRCIVPADGFYEWVRAPTGGRQPYHVRSVHGAPLAFAGVWDVWRSPERGERLVTCSIITTTANEVIAPVHDRMPVVLPRSAWEPWLDPSNDDVEELRALLVPAPAAEFVVERVGTAVNDVRNDGPHLLDPVEQAG